MKYLCCVVIVAFLGAPTLAANTDDTSLDAMRAGREQAVNLCSTCHGPRGISTSPEFPVLAAQREGYLIAQMKAFRDKTRAEKDAHDFMWGIAVQLDEATIAGIARYYSVQPPAQGRLVDPALVVEGRVLYERGAPERDVPACQTCHGQNAEGDAETPRLAGQHAKYVAKQLGYMQRQDRETPRMRGFVKSLTPENRQAVAAYVQSR